MKNVGHENEVIQETLENEIQTPIIIEKAKKPRKKRESNSPAQLETLRRGRERRAEKRKQQLEEKINEPLNKLDEVYDMCDRVLKRLDEQKKDVVHVPVHVPVPVQVAVQEKVEYEPPKRTKFFLCESVRL